MHETSYAFDVANLDYSRRIRGYSSAVCNDICIIWNDATEFYRPDVVHLGERPDRVELCLTSGIQATELIAVFEMIRVFTAADIPSYEASQELQAEFTGKWHKDMGIPPRVSWARNPETDYAAFAGMPGFARLGEIAQDFDFGPHLPPATFPPAFVAAYTATALNDPVDWDGERTHFVARFAAGDEVARFDGLFSPDVIQSENAIISNVFGTERTAPVMPLGHYAVGEAFGDLDTFRILICLDTDSPQHGHLFLWRFTSEVIEIDESIADPRATAPLASRLEDFWPLLTTSADAHATALGSPLHLIVTPKLTNAVAHAAEVFAPYRTRARFRGPSAPTDLSRKELATLRRIDKQPLGTVSGDLILDWHQSTHGPLTAEAQDDLRALLPRMFELIAQNDPYVGDHLADALLKLGEVDWRSTWSDEEVWAVEFFGISLFEACLSSDGIGPFWQGAEPTGIRTALPLPSYLVMLIEGGFDLNALIERWIELLAVEDVGAVRHAASLRFLVQPHIDGAFVDLGMPDNRHRAVLGRFAALLFDQGDWAMECRLKCEIASDERQLLEDALAYRPERPA